VVETVLDDAVLLTGPTTFTSSSSSSELLGTAELLPAAMVLVAMVVVAIVVVAMVVVMELLASKST